jgi:type IV secretion system protein VirB5
MKNKIKQIGFSIAALSIVSTSSYALFGVGDVVHDPIQTAKAVAEYAEQAKRWTSTVQNYRNELLAKTGVRDVISFQREMSDLMDFMDHYSLDFMDLSNDIVDRPRSQVGQYAKHLFDQYNLFDDCQYDYLSDDQKRICKNQMVRNVQEIATYQHTTQKLKSISSKLSELARKRERSQDIKESEDISNAIQMQIAQLQIIKTQVDLMEAQNRSKARVDQRQIVQLRKQRQNNVDFSY